MSIKLGGQNLQLQNLQGSGLPKPLEGNFAKKTEGDNQSAHGAAPCYGVVIDATIPELQQMIVNWKKGLCPYATPDQIQLILRSIDYRIQHGLD